MHKKTMYIIALILTSVLLSGGCVDISQGTAMELPVGTEDTGEPVEPVGADILLITPDDIGASALTASPIPDFVLPDIGEYHQRLEEIREARNVYGMGVAVFRNGDIVYADGLGYADTENGVQCTVNTHFRAASVSKLVSTILIMKMCDEGLITLESVLDDATGLPYSLPGAGEARLWNLLTHTAGITDTYLYEDGLANKYTTEYILQHSLTGIAPGTFYNYTNFGAGTMGTVIEKITGEYFHDYADEQLFKPLGMDAGYIIDLIEDKESCALIYDTDGEVYDPRTWNRTREYYESFGLGNSYLEAQCELLITPADLARIGTALAGDGTVKECGGKRILSEASTEKMHEIYIETGLYGMGLNVRRYDGTLVEGRTLYGHPGNALGGITGIFYDRSDRTGVVVMTNHCSYAINESTNVYRFLEDVVRETYSSFF